MIVRSPTRILCSSAVILRSLTTILRFPTVILRSRTMIVCSPASMLQFGACRQRMHPCGRACPGPGTMIQGVPTMIRGVRTMIPRVPTTIPVVPASSARSGLRQRGGDRGRHRCRSCFKPGEDRENEGGHDRERIMSGWCWGRASRSSAPRSPAWMSTSPRSHASKRARSRSTNRVSRTWWCLRDRAHECCGFEYAGVGR